MTDHVFALGATTTARVALHEEEVLAACGDDSDECVLVTSRRVVVIADGAQLSCDFADRATGTGPARACVARKGERIAALLWRGDAEGTKPEAAFFEVQERCLRRTASGRKTSGRVPRWLLPARGLAPKSGLAAITRCGALVQLSWRGTISKQSDVRVVPAAVGTDLLVLDARSSDAGHIAAVVRQRSEMHRNNGAFVALLEPSQNRRRRVCEVTTLGFGEPRACDLERSGERVVVAWEGGVTVHAFQGGEPLLARACAPVIRYAVRWVPGGDAFLLGGEGSPDWHLLSGLAGSVARGALAAPIATLACASHSAWVASKDGRVDRVPLAFNDSRTPCLRGRDHVVCVKSDDAWPRCALSALGLQTPPKCVSVSEARVAVAGRGLSVAIADLGTGHVSAAFLREDVHDLQWCFPILLAASLKRLCVCSAQGVPMAVDGHLPIINRFLCSSKIQETYRVAYVDADGLAKAFSLRPGKVVPGEVAFFVCEVLETEPLVVGPRGHGCWAGTSLIILDDGLAKTKRSIIARRVNAIAPAASGVVLFGEEKTWAWFPGDAVEDLIPEAGALEAIRLEDLDPFTAPCGFAHSARVVVQALRQGTVHEPTAHASSVDMLGAVVRACVCRCSRRFAASIKEGTIGMAFDHFAAAPDPLVDGDIREAALVLGDAAAEDATTALAAHVAESAALAAAGDVEQAFASRALLWLARHVLQEGGLLRVACRAARPLEPVELEALFYHGRRGTPSPSALDTYARLDAPRGLFTRCLHIGKLATAAELLPLVSAGLYDDHDASKARGEMLGASRELLWRTLGGRDEHDALAPVWRFARRCEGSSGDTYSRIDVTFCEWDDAAWDARHAATDEVACRAIARHLACATPGSIKRAATCCLALQSCEEGWPNDVARKRCVVRFQYARGSNLTHVVTHALDSLVAAFGEEVILGLVSTKHAERLQPHRDACEALLAFCDAYKVDGFRAVLSVALGVHAECAPKLAAAVYKAFERSGAAPDVVSRAEQMSVIAAHANHHSFRA